MLHTHPPKNAVDIFCSEMCIRACAVLSIVNLLQEIIQQRAQNIKANVANTRQCSPHFLETWKHPAPHSMSLSADFADLIFVDILETQDTQGKNWTFCNDLSQDWS